MAKTDIGPKISIDGEPEYRKQINNLIQQAKTLDSEMRAVTSAFNENTSAAEKAAAKSTVLNKQIDVQKQKIEQLRVMVEKSAGMYGETANETLKWKQKLNDATASLNNMEKELRDTSKGMDDLERNTEESAKEMQTLERNAQGVGTELDGAGKSAGSFGTTLKAVLTSQVITAGVRMLTDAAKALANAMADLVKESFTAYADYEQLSGGIATLFSSTTQSMEEYVGRAVASGKTLQEANSAWMATQEGAVIAMQNADTAYERAGMSANKYMETTTSFAAALTKSLGGDTVEAARLADQAIVDMSDNWNRFGTDSENVIHAYVGFAKQQYNMLDNLNLGYAANQQGMYELLQRAAELDKEFAENAVFSMDSKGHLEVGFADVVRALHIIQTDLGVTGTTAEEAATTISGSANMVKAAWENVQVAIASGNDETIKQNVDNLVSSVLVLADNALPRLKEILGGVGTLVKELAPAIAQELPSLLTDVLPTLIDSALTLVQTLLTTVVSVLPDLFQKILPMAMNLLNTILTDVLPQITTTALQLVQFLAQGVAQAAPMLIPAAIEALLQLVHALVGTEGAQILIDAALALLLGLAEGITTAVPILAEQAPIIISELVNALIKNLPAIAEAGYSIMLSLYGALFSMYPTIWSGILDLCVGIVETIGDMDWIEVGKHFVLTIAEGALGVATDLLNSIEKVFAPTTKWVDALIGDSKSWGSDMIQGFIDGIRSIRRKLENAVADVAKLIREYLHFSRPDKGPLRDYETYMPHMIQGMVKGIEDNKYKLRNAVSGMAGDVALAASNGAHISNRSVNVGAPIINVYGRDGQSVNELADAVAYKLHNTVERREIAWA